MNVLYKEKHTLKIS